MGAKIVAGACDNDETGGRATGSDMDADADGGLDTAAVPSADDVPDAIPCVDAHLLCFAIAIVEVLVSVISIRCVLKGRPKFSLMLDDIFLVCLSAS